MFRVGIIIPSWHYWVNPSRIQPIYELYFATVIDARFSGKGISVQIIDLRGIRSDQQIYRIPKLGLYLYWIAKTGDYPEIENLVKSLRLLYPQAKHAAGGTHVDIFAAECALIFDAVVVGPGEESFIKIIRDCRKNTLRKTYKQDYEEVKYADYPFMRRHYLPENAIVNNLLFEKYGPSIRSTCVLFSRGCIFRCKFCVYNVPKKIQMRALGSIAEEITYLKKEYRVQAINLKDEICIPADRKIARDYFSVLKRSRIIWRGQTAIFGVDEEILRLAQESGCVELAVGIESVSQRVLDIIGKNIKIEQARAFIKNCKKCGIRMKMCLIFGLPGEPQDIVSLTSSFIEETKPDYVSLSGFDPVPGCEIYNQKGYYGIKYIDLDWGKHAHLLYRFSDEEEVGIPYEYAQTNRWGATFSRLQIIENIRAIQGYLRERNMTY
jgi:radical SAM superfamily enzyme YgiQ (UPF0313 family)